MLATAGGGEAGPGILLQVARVMAVLNVTPDSFSDGGQWFEPDRAVAHGLALADAGADVVDVGGESTRPGSLPVDEDEELRRVVPVVEALAGRVRVSIDTRKPTVAEAAVAAGATLINDTSARLWPVAAATGVGWVAMHMRGEPADMNQLATYDDVVGEVRDFLLERARQATDAGVKEIWIDPGIGFAKNAGHNLELLAHLDALVETGWPVVVGTSRKSFLGAVTVPPGAPAAPVEDRLEASVATAVWSLVHGAAMVRVHDVVPTVTAVRLLEGEGSEAA
jgi:dihydropteroate synthase